MAGLLLPGGTGHAHTLPTREARSSRQGGVSRKGLSCSSDHSQLRLRGGRRESLISGVAPRGSTPRPCGTPKASSGLPPQPRSLSGPFKTLLAPLGPLLSRPSPCRSLTTPRPSSPSPLTARPPAPMSILTPCCVQQAPARPTTSDRTPGQDPGVNPTAPPTRGGTRDPHREAQNHSRSEQHREENSRGRPTWGLP